MGTFTTVSKKKIAWPAPPPVEVVGEAYELLISDDYKLDIGGGFNLTIKPAATTIQYTHIDKTKNTWPEPLVQTSYHLDIGNGFNLLIDDTNKLIINTSRPETKWTPLTRRKTIY